MKSIPKFTPSLCGVFIATATFASGDILLEDQFDNGNLASNPGAGGGFFFLTNGIAGDGTVIEEASAAKIQDGTLNNTSGILSTNGFDLSDPNETYTIIWQISEWLPGPTGELRRIFLSLQSNNDFLFVGGDEESKILIELDETNDDSYLRYQNRANGINSNLDSEIVAVGPFNDDPDGFTATLVIDSNGYTFTTLGLNSEKEVNITGTWTDLGTDFTTVTGTDGPMHVGAYFQDIGQAGAELSFDAISISTGSETSGPLQLQISKNDSTLDFAWNSQAEKTYRLVSSTDLSTPSTDWEVYNDGVNQYENIPPSGTGTNQLTGVIPLGEKRFFAIIEN